MIRAAVLVIVTAQMLAFAATAEGGSSLVAVSRPARSSAKLTYSSTDAIAGLAKGSGTDANALSVDVFVRHGDGRAIFTIPRGAYGGAYGWLVNDASRATFSNRAAPAAPTGVARTVFSVGRRVKVSAKNVGDIAPLDLTGPPSDVVRVAYVVTNGSEIVTHCTQFAPDRCTYTAIDGGTGWRLRCRDGVADLQCGARPVCGNGVRERGEHCDGGAFCSAECKQGITSCCQGQDICIEAPVFSLQGYLHQYCSSVSSPPEPRAGYTCSDSGECVDLAIEPIPTCCQDTPTTCTGGSAASIAQLWFARYYCIAGGFDFSKPRFNAVCGANGICTPQ